METFFIAFAVLTSILAFGASAYMGYAFFFNQPEKSEPEAAPIIEPSQEPDVKLENVVLILGEVMKRLQEVEAQQVPVDETLPTNPGGCTKDGHEWRNHWSMVNDHEHVYYCSRNCGSSLRHRFE